MGKDLQFCEPNSMHVFVLKMSWVTKYIGKMYLLYFGYYKKVHFRTYVHKNFLILNDFRNMYIHYNPRVAEHPVQ